MRTWQTGRILLLVATITLAVSACGRRGPLEPPPSVTARQEAAQQDGAPEEEPKDSRSFFLDFLID